jgi:hypothetical protein
MKREVLFDMNDIREIRPRCDLCAYELTFAEFLLLENRCVFHADNAFDLRRNVSKLKYIKLLLGDLNIFRAKIKMKERGMTAVDYMACVGTVKPDLHDIIDEHDMEKLLRAMDKHTGVVA